MKKAILGISGLLAAIIVVFLLVSAANPTQEVKKPTNASSADCAACPSATVACPMAATKTAEVVKAEVKTCDPAKCKEMGCDPAKCKDGKCDPATCKANCTAATGTKGCSATCPGMATK